MDNDMTIEDMKKFINDWQHLDYIMPSDIPSIQLYMDQVTTFMDKQLVSNKRTAEDKILTKTMINNYTKNNLLPPPDKKKYSKNHIILLIYIYYLKNFISITDIKNLLEPMIDTYFDDGTDADALFKIYESVFELETTHHDSVAKGVYECKCLAESKFPEADDKYLHDIAFILVMSYDIYLKKQIIENMIDKMVESRPTKDINSEKVKEKPTRDKNKDKVKTK